MGMAVTSERIVVQYAHSVADFSSQYGNDMSISYVVPNLAGEPGIYPNYGDFTQAAVFRTYGPWWALAPSAPEPFPRTPPSFISEDYVELHFKEKVYPTELEIYETFNPGAIVRILACNTSATKKSRRWAVLWSSTPDCAPAEPRIFKPKICHISFRTNVIRLEFNHSMCDYYTELDAVRLHGYISPSPSPSPSGPLMNCINPSNPQFAGSYGYCFDAPPSYESVMEEDRRKAAEAADALEPSRDSVVQELSRLHIRDGLSAALDDSDNGYFDLLPEEVIQLIISYLDVPSMCKLAITSQFLHKHCYDPLQYTELNLQPYWHQLNDDSIEGLTTRCRHLQRMNLSWCGTHRSISNEGSISKLLQSCGRELHCLRLANCPFVNNQTIKIIVDNCPNLAELDVAGNKSLDNVAFTKLTKLDRLERLNLYRSMIDTHGLIAIIRCCANIQYLNIGACYCVNNFDEVCIEIGKSCTNLKTIDMWRAKTLTEIGLSALADNCPLLEELDLGWCSALKSSSQCFTDLVSKCHRIKKLYLTANRSICDYDLEHIATHCPELEQLDILGTREITHQAACRVLMRCPNMKMFDVSFCANIDFVTTKSWSEKFPNVAVKKSFQN